MEIETNEFDNEVIEEEELPVWCLDIKELNNNRTRIDNVDPNGTVLDLKLRVSEIMNLRIARQRMIFCGKGLENGKKLKDYGIANLSCVHLLKRAESAPLTATDTPNSNAVGTRSNTANTNQTRTRSPWNLDTTELSRIINSQVRTSTTSRRLGRKAPVGDNVEHIYQGLASLETLDAHFSQRREKFRSRYLQSKKGLSASQKALMCLDDTNLDVENCIPTFVYECLEESVEEKRGSSAMGSSDSFECYYDSIRNETVRRDQSIRVFQRGQWIDCLDTVNQWLEATVVHVYEDRKRIKVHYNGWGVRWDETIDVNSSRIARFRTKSRNKAQCKNFSPTLSHWVKHTPKLGTKDLGELGKEVKKSAMKVFSQLQRVSNDEYGDCESFEEALEMKRQDILELAPKLDIVGRAIADMGRAFANRPNFKRRQDFVYQHNTMLHLTRLPLMPFGLITSMEKDRRVNSDWNRCEHEELLTNLEYDKNLVKLSHGPNALSQSRPSRNVELHLHTIVAADVRGNQTPTVVQETSIGNALETTEDEPEVELDMDPNVAGVVAHFELDEDNGNENE